MATGGRGEVMPWPQLMGHGRSPLGTWVSGLHVSVIRCSLDLKSKDLPNLVLSSYLVGVG